MSIVKNFGEDVEMKNKLYYLLKREERSEGVKKGDIIKVEDFTNNKRFMDKIINDTIHKTLRKFFSDYVVKNSK
tara:strand:+ start:1401 stop:1622 length:222 start_codon:yes stop_codon:yes gene_type:complete